MQVRSLLQAGRERLPVGVTEFSQQLLLGGTVVDLLLVAAVGDRSRFDPATITRTLGHFQTLLEGMAANPELRLH